MSDEPEETPEDEPEAELEEEELEEVELPKTGAAAWKERRAAIMGKGASGAAGGKQPGKSGGSRVVEQRRQNSGRDAAQTNAKNSNRVRKSPRG